MRGRAAFTGWYHVKRRDQSAASHSRRCRRLDVSYRSWGGLLDAAAPCSARDSGPDHPAPLVQAPRQAVTPARFRLAQAPGTLDKALTARSNNRTNHPVQSRVAATQATITSVGQSENIPAAVREAAPECGIVNPLFQGCGSYSPPRLFSDADTPQANPPRMGIVYS